MKHLNFNFKSVVRNKARWLLTIIAILALGVGELWADYGFFDKGMWQVQLSDDGGTTTYWTPADWPDNGGYTDVGVKTSLMLKGCNVNVWSKNTGISGCRLYYWINGGDAGGNYWHGEGHSNGDKVYTWNSVISYDAVSKAGGAPGYYTLKLKWKLSDNNDVQSKDCSVNFTIPGFSASSGTVDFGSSTPVDAESETFGVSHYGTMGSYSITGTNADEFEMKIDGNSVKVFFKPTSAGPKSATLTMSDNYGTSNSSCTLTLTGTAAEKGAATRLYFNNYNYNSNWEDKSALSRFTCEYTTGVYTHYPMTKCANSAYNWYADVEIKGATVTVDRYNPSSPYQTWNTASISGINASNPYAVIDNLSDGVFYGFATNHPYNDVSGGTVYYDNSKSGLTNTIYLVIGHDYKMSGGGTDDEYSKVHALGYISNTKLYYTTFSETWHDADYYAFIGASSAPSEGKWGSDDLSSKASSSSYTGIFREVMDLKSGSTYLGFAPSKTGGALSMTKSPTLNTTQTFNYALSTDGGSTYSALTSGPNTPGQLEMTAYEFTSAACTAVMAKDDEELTLSANSTTYTSSISNVAYTGTTTLEASESRDGYTFVGWYNGNTRRTSSTSFEYYPQGDSTFTARYKAHTFTVKFNANYPSGAVNNGASMADQDFVYEVEQNLTANAFACEGYTFTGWKKDNATSGDDVTAGSDGSTLSTTDGATVNLYAQWSDDGTYYYKGASASGWATAANWTRNAVPGAGDDVIALTALNAPSGTTTVNSVRIATSGTYTPVGGSGITANGSLTIPGGSALKVATSIANCTINENAPTSGTSTTSSTLNIGTGGALAWGATGSPGDATVGFYTVSGGVPGSQDARNDYIGIPFTSLSSDAYSNAWVFAVSGGAWTEISGATLSPWTGYNIIEKKEKSGEFGGSYSLTGTLVANNATVSGGASAGTETLYANSWVAPIEISEMSITGTATVYLFRPTSFNDIEDAADPLGNYDTYPVNSSSGVYIPSMKSFSVVSSTVSINYASAVYGKVGGAYSAPRRERKADYRQAIWDTQDTLFVTVKSASGWGDVLKMFIHEDFSQDYENGWDGPKMEGMWEAPKLYMLNNEGEMAVSCVPTAENSVIAFHAGTAANEYTFQFKYSGEEALVLKDTKTGVETPIEDGGTYEFTSNTSDDDMRFMIKKVSNAATGVDEIGGNASGVQKIMHNGAMYIIREGRIYSAEGTLIK